MILHVDMDAFYASVEEREQPPLRGKPLVVGGRPELRGVVAAANYTARAFGIRSAMPTARAVRLCPQLIVLPPRGALYSSVSKQIHEIFRRYTPQIEPLSLDEAFLDVRGSEKLYGDAEEIGLRIKAEILEELRLVASVGVAPNKFLAKLASDEEKPDGFTVIREHEIQQYLDPLPVSRIWGVGKVAQKKLNDRGIITVFDMRQTSEEYLEAEFGKIGRRLWQLCFGIDNRKVISDSEARSVSRETTFDVDVTDLATLQSVALSLTDGVCFRLRDAGIKAKTVNLKVRFHDFSTVTRAKSLDHATDCTLEIWQILKEMMQTLLGNRQFSVRLIGLGLSNLGPAGADHEVSSQADIFQHTLPPNNKDQDPGRQQILDKLSDQIRRKYGKDTIRRGKAI